MNRLCIIPARGGSKGVPRKNLIEIGGESLARRAARCAVAAGVFERIVVSTDDAEIASEAAAGGAETPFMRPADLASDKAAVIDAVRHAVGALDQTGWRCDLITLLEPTSPCRTPEIVRELVDAVCRFGADSGTTLSLVPDNYRPVKQMHLANDGLTSDVAPMPPGIYRRQDLPPTYIRNGMAYVMTRTCAIDDGRIIGTRNYGMVVKRAYVNIDWPEDVELARRLLEHAPEGSSNLPR